MRKTTCVLMAIGMLLFVPPFLTMALSESPAFVLQLLSLLLLPSALRDINKRGYGSLFLVGLTAGMATLFRPILLLQVPIMAVAVALAYWRIKKAIPGAVARAAVLVAGFVIILAPWTIRNYTIYNAFLPVSYNGGEVFYSANASPSFMDQGRYLPSSYEQLRKLEPDPIKRNQLGMKLGFSAILSHPGMFIASIPYRIGQILGRAVLWPASYINGTAKSPWGLPEARILILATAMLFGSWVLMFCLYLFRRPFKAFVIQEACVSWVFVAFVVITAASMLFECVGKTAITLVPYLIAMVAQASQSGNQNSSKTNPDNAANVLTDQGQ